MNIKESLSTALGGLRANKLRSILTMLGVIIGVASVIALSSLGTGLSEFIGDLITGTGAELISISGTDEGGYPTLTQADFDTLSAAENAPEIASVAAVASANLPVVAGEISTLTTVSGVTDNYFAVNNQLDLADGGLFSATDEQVVVLAATVADYLFPEGGAVGATVTIAGQPFTIVGVQVAAEAGGGSPFGGAPPTGGQGGAPAPPNGGQGAGGGRGGPFGANVAGAVYMPLNVATKSLPLPTTQAGELALSTIQVAATDETAVEAAIEQTDAVMRASHGLTDDATPDFLITSSAASAALISTITATLTSFISAIAGISLVVGGIGIMNIMLVSVTERTREIGIRKAVGAVERDILLQFMLEALVLSLLGGLIGLLLGWVVSTIGADWIGITAVLTPAAIGLAIGFSVAVGLIFGIYPAWQAARLRPIEALRYE